MSQPLLEPNIPVDLSNCDLEPIHIPSSIQPHGMLLAARRSDLRIVYVSDNVESFLGVAPSFVLEKILPEILGLEAVHSIEQALGQDFYVPKEIRTFAFPIRGDQRFDVTAHRTQDLLCLELELSNEEKRWDLLSSLLEGAMRTLGLAKTLPDLCAATAPVLRALTGYDRVMVYRFDADGHGEVVAEDRAAEMSPFLGLHYPATDIPSQARRLYLQHRIGMIVDVNYVPVPVLGNRSFIDNAPLDMTFCGLRSVSPIHIEYLKNMGVGASLTLSLIVEGKLWGMILGHHRTPRHPAPESRALCDLLGQLVSLFLGAKRKSDEAAEERHKQILLEVLATSIESGLQLEQSLVRSGDALLALVGADGAVFKIGDRLSLIGKTPGSEEASLLLTAFEARIRAGTAYSREIGASFPAFSHLATSASGGLMVPLGGPGNGILWLRGQMAESVRWAGEPDVSKQLSEVSSRLSPRKSFAVWEQTQHGRSISWRVIEIEAALSLERIAARALEIQLTERSLRDQALVLDMAEDSVFIRDGKDRITYWNQGAMRLYGWSKEEALGHVARLLLKMKFAQPIEEIEAHLLAHGYWKGELVHTRRDGSLITVSSSWTTRYDEATQDASVLEINQDITPRKEIERELENNRREMLNGSLRLLAVNKELEQFAYVASHDLKAPLRVIDNASKWLEEDLAQHLTPDTRETMKLLRGRVQRMEKLLDDLLEYARIGRTPEGPPSEKIAGDSLVHDVLALLPTNNFTFEIAPLFSTIQISRMPLQRILSNLIGNAIKHHDKPQGRIGLTMKEEKGFYAFAVRDDGPGIPTQFHDQIFKMFQTLRPRDQVEGSGMGLAMARKTVELFGGALSVESNSDRGCTFRFTWPIED